ncbi:DNA mismatch repair endonuclease MutL [Microbacter margulisiae]|uniref:DNA mismatch repair protein MutL n=1 Tax=Microbacter margulisiae TaxID=1350067 RepID=A0A7W5DR02_9PORP|nr:DNA mismatch repair endonuclease MutL [Microbacter margulisiae]MBB3187140.1 DNA mismatch repair protein MutL [Microbacter margulisiae]
MHDIIHLLPDHVANQIAAGEVIQRPASVLKELVENAIDAEATLIQVILKDAGRTLIQVIDNGKGMSETDVRMAFERHATSKIQDASDLFALHTMGFRGEALASIAAVAQIEVHTRREEDELGSLIAISGSHLEKQEVISCPKGTVFFVKNLFFNVPARRKFLKSNETELRQLIMELTRIALVYPQLQFTLHHNDTELLRLMPSNHRQRIGQLFPSRNHSTQHQLLPISAETSMVSISGYVGTPETSVRNPNQFFFVNGRYMRHPYFHKAVMQAYEGMIASPLSPSYFIYFEIDPATIDVNIHPTKTEIKFEHEPAVWSILLAAVKESLSKSHAIPSIEFDQEGAIDIPPMTTTKAPAEQPRVNVNPAYNPFDTYSERSSHYTRPPMNWESLYQDFEKPKETLFSQKQVFPSEDDTQQGLLDEEHEGKNYLLYKNRFILAGGKSGLMFVDRQRAHIRILFEQWMRQLRERKGFSQQLLFPEMISLSIDDALLFETVLPELQDVGFDLSSLGKDTFVINGVPAGFEKSSVMSMIELLIDTVKHSKGKMKEVLDEAIALTMAKSAAVNNDRPMTQDEMGQLLGQLFTCENPNTTPDGKPIVVILGQDEIEKKF